jgi:hypothetical protein
MFSPDKRKRKPKKSRRLRNNDSDSSPEKPIHPKEFIEIKGRPQSSLLNIPLYPPSTAQNISFSNETGQPESVTKAEDNSGSDVATVAEIDAKSEYQKMGYTDKLSIAVQMVPELLAGDVKQALEQLLCDPAFVAELVAAGVVFAGLQATPAGPLIDAVMVATLGLDVALKLGGFLYKSHTANDENDLRTAAEDLKGFIEIAGMAGATKLLGMAGRALKNLKGEATVVDAEAAANVGRAESEVRYMKGKKVEPLERTYEFALNKQAHAKAIVKKYGINLKGINGRIEIVIDSNLRPSVKGLTKYPEGGNVIHISERFMIEGDEADIANTIAHELSHARDFQRGKKAGIKSLAEAEARGFEKPHGHENSPAGDGTVYGSGHALEEYIRGKR